jgi:hypothetical protein
MGSVPGCRGRSSTALWRVEFNLRSALKGPCSLGSCGSEESMGAGIQHTSSRGRGRMRRRAMAEINVTPFVDVMLVLLIVFMVTAPLLTVGVPG